MCFAKPQWILLVSVLFMVRNEVVESILTRGPSDQVAVKGSTVVLSCYTNLSRPVYWDTEKAGDNHDNNWYAVYQGNPSVITYQFDKRFNMSVDSTGNQYNLTIHDVQMEDAGTYRCGDNFGLALHDYKKGIPNQGATAELTVLSSNLTCSQNLSVNYNGGSDTLSSELINCSISYEGRIIPTLKWTTDWNNGDGRNQSRQDFIFTQNSPTTDAGLSTITSTIIVSSPKGIGKTGLKCAVLTSSGYRTGFEQQSDNNSLSYFSSFTPGVALFCGILLGVLSFAIILFIGLTFKLRTIQIWKIKITTEAEADGTSNSETLTLLPTAYAAEKIILTLGLHTPGEDFADEQKICHISLKTPKTVEVIDSAPTFIWPGSSACVVSNVLYAVGIGRDPYIEMWAWSMSSEEWTKCADMTSDTGRCFHCVTSVDDKIYVLGGFLYNDKKAMDSILCYDMNSKSWCKAGNLSHAVHSAACVSYKHYVYVFGGDIEKNKCVNHVQIYDTTTCSVSLASNPMPTAYNLMRAVPWQSKALLVGRYTCYIYDFETSTWQERKRFKTDVEKFGLTLDDETLYISGGGTLSTTGVWKCRADVKSLLIDHFISNNKKARWQPHANLPTPACIYSHSPVSLTKAVSTEKRC